MGSLIGDAIVGDLQHLPRPEIVSGFLDRSVGPEPRGFN